MKIRCIESVKMNVESGYQAFTKGEEYRAREKAETGLGNDPYEVSIVVTAKNDKGESHIIKHKDNGALDSFFEKHFEVIK